MSGISALYRASGQHFIKTVAQAYNQQNRCTGPLPTGDEIVGTRRMMNGLPVDLAVKATEFPKSLSEWLVLTGMFDRTFKRTEAEEIIEASSKLKLEQIAINTDAQIVLTENRRKSAVRSVYRSLIGRVMDRPQLVTSLTQKLTAWRTERDHLSSSIQQRKHVGRAIEATQRSVENLFPISAKQSLLNYLFVQTFVAAPDNEKEKIISAAQAFQPLFDNTQSLMQKTGIKIGSFVASIFNNTFIRLIASVYFWRRCMVIGQLVQKTMAQAIVAVIPETMLAAAVSACPAIVIRAAGIVGQAVSLSFAYRIPLVLSWVGISIVLAFFDVPENWHLQKINDIVFRTLLFAPLIVTYIPGIIADKVFSFVFSGSGQIGESLQGMSDRTKADRFETEGEKARFLWHKLASDASAARARA